MFKTNSFSFKKRIESLERFFYGSGLKIIIWGFGVTGKSLLSFCQKYLPSNNTYIVVDKNCSQEIVIDHILYTNNFEILSDSDVDYILPSPGIKLDKIALYYKKIIPEFDIFFYFKNKINYQVMIITGSVGKTSVSTMIHFYLEKKFRHVILAGNIGYPLLDIIENIAQDSIIVIEASSAQLEHAELVSPEYFVITNLYSNHLDMHDNFYSYGMAKLKPLSFLSSIKKIFIDTTVLNFIMSLDTKLLQSDMEKIICIEESQIVESVQKHDNCYFYKNFMIARECDFPSFSYGKNWLLVSCIRFFMTGAMIDFDHEGLPCLPLYRLERIFESDTIVIYNDSKSTVIESTLAAVEEVRAMHPLHKIYCIIGGLSKGVDRKYGISKIISMSNRVYFFGAEEKMYSSVSSESKSLEDIVLEVSREVLSGNPIKYKVVLLFSPGGSSFDLYKSYIHRGLDFNNLINKYFQFHNIDTLNYLKVADHALP